MFDEKEEFSITESELRFKGLERKFGAVNHDISSANVLSIPISHEGITDNKIFHQSITDVYEYFHNSELHNSYDIYADDEEFNELALHADDIWLGSFLVAGVIVPLLNIKTTSLGRGAGSRLRPLEPRGLLMLLI